MKKNIIIGVACVIMSLQQLAAQDSLPVNGSVARRFEESFTGARNVQWTSLPKKVSQAQFYYQGGSWIAFFDHAGQLITSGRKIKSTQDLPLKVQAGLNRAKSRMERKAESFQVAIIYEMIKDEVTKYYITMQNPTTTALVSINSEGGSMLESKKVFKPELKTPKDVIAKTN